MGRMNWDDANTNKLLLILIEEKDRGGGGGGGRGGGFKFDWVKVAKIFSTQIGTCVNAKQASNHYFAIKHKFRASQEFHSLTGVTYNPVTKDVDVEERSLEQYNSFKQRNAKYGLKLFKQNLANADELRKLFGGTAVHRVVMGKRRPSCLTTPIQEINEGYGDNDDDHRDGGDTLSGDESKSSPWTVARKTSWKQKGEDTVSSSELKRRLSAFDTIVQLLSSAGIDLSNRPSKPQMISDELTTLEVADKKGDRYFISALKYLNDVKHADTFLALKNDKHKLIYLRMMDADPLFT